MYILTTEAPPSSTTSHTIDYTHDSHPRTQLERYLTHTSTTRPPSLISCKHSPRSIIFQLRLFLFSKNRNTIDSKNQFNRPDTSDLIASRQKPTPSHKYHKNLASYKALLTLLQFYPPYHIPSLTQPCSLCRIDKPTTVRNSQIPPSSKHLQKSSTHHKTKTKNTHDPIQLAIQTYLDTKDRNQKTKTQSHQTSITIVPYHRNTQYLLINTTRKLNKPNLALKIKPSNTKTSIDTHPSLTSKLPPNTCNTWNQQAQNSPTQKLALTTSLQNCVHRTRQGNKKYRQGHITTLEPSCPSINSQVHMSSSRAALSHNIQEQRSHRSGKPSHSIHVSLFFLAHMCTKLTIGHSIETHRLDTHNQRRNPQNLVYPSLHTTETNHAKNLPKYTYKPPNRTSNVSHTSPTSHIYENPSQ
jgi:hypothetical protein